MKNIVTCLLLTACAFASCGSIMKKTEAGTRWKRYISRHHDFAIDFKHDWKAKNYKNLYSFMSPDEEIFSLIVHRNQDTFADWLKKHDTVNETVNRNNYFEKDDYIPGIIILDEKYLFHRNKKILIRKVEIARAGYESMNAYIFAGNRVYEISYSLSGPVNKFDVAREKLFYRMLYSFFISDRRINKK